MGSTPFGESIAHQGNYERVRAGTQEPSLVKLCGLLHHKKEQNANLEKRLAFFHMFEPFYKSN